MTAHAPTLVTRHRWLALLLGGLLLAVFAGCGSAGSNDPLAAGRVDGQTITLSDYQQIANVFKTSAESQGQSAAWQSSQGRTQLASAEHSAFDFLVGLQLMREQLASQHVTVSSQVRTQVAKSFATQLDQLRAQQKQNPTSAQQALLDSLTPHTIALLEEQGADQQALAAKVKVPTVTARAIPVSSQAKAQALLQQAAGGADFATLAKNNSTDATLAANGGDLGTVFVGEYGTQFDTAVFAPGAHPGKYLILPFSQQYVLFQLGSVTPKPLSSLANAQSEQTYFSAWLTTVVRKQAQVDQYVTIG